MRTLPRLILLLAALFALFTVAAGFAQTPQASQTLQVAPLTTEQFLATLSGGQGAAPGTEVLPPDPRFLQSTACTSNADCPPDQLCCYPCGIEGCSNVCMTPWRKNQCPPIA
ncbi:MAG TPA: hypothetical protein VHC97_00110 [Thermoanaerobaculia bacterium]|jgi:hypothetical protein|nr:hypothetical protein [Thermoanaerobaculia bacterium]